VALFEADAANGIDEVFADMRAAGIDAASVFPSAEFVFHREDLAKAALRHRLPTIYDFREHVTAGGLAAYAARTEDLLVRAADYAARLLKGDSPSALPIELPTRFQLIINTRAAQALGLQIPAALLARADEVIE
jgi:putative tryptophan/tyrosine transport system substrate-binding protein